MCSTNKMAIKSHFEKHRFQHKLTLSHSGKRRPRVNASNYPCGWLSDSFSVWPRHVWKNQQENLRDKYQHYFPGSSQLVPDYWSLRTFQSGKDHWPDLWRVQVCTRHWQCFKKGRGHSYFLETLIWDLLQKRLVIFQCGFFWLVDRIGEIFTHVN